MNSETTRKTKAMRTDLAGLSLDPSLLERELICDGIVR